MSGKFEDLLKINKSGLPLEIIDQLPTLNEYDGSWTVKEIAQTVNALKDHVRFLESKAELYEKTFAAMFGKKEDRDRFIEMAKTYGGATDNFEIIKIMNAFNRLRPIEKPAEKISG